MSLGIAFKGPEGIVLAADSRVTLSVGITDPQGKNILLPATYDNATKLLEISNHNYVGAVTYGAGAIGTTEQRTAHSYIPEFEAELAGTEIGRFTVEDFSARLSRFFMERWTQNMPGDYQGSDMIFLVGGYDLDAPYGRVFEIFIPGTPDPNELNPDSFGIAWGGQRELVDRVIQGFDESLPHVIQSFLQLDDHQRDELRTHLKDNLSLQIPYGFLPLQDCVDLSISLIRTTITFQTKLLGVRGVGGLIEVATITATDGFTPIQRKKIKGEELP